MRKIYSAFIVLAVLVSANLVSAVNVTFPSKGDGIYANLVYRNQSTYKPVIVDYSISNDTPFTENYTFYNSTFTLNVGNGSEYNSCNMINEWGTTIACWGNMRIGFNQSKLIENGLSYNAWYNISVFLKENETINLTQDLGRFKFLLTPQTFGEYKLSTNESGEIFLNSTLFWQNMTWEPNCECYPNLTKYMMTTLLIVLSTNVTNANFTIASYSEIPSILNISTSAIGKYVELESDKNIINNLLWYYVKIYFNDSDVKAGVNKNLLKMWYYNETTQKWTVVSNSGVNTTENYVWMNATHFSTFGIAPYQEEQPQQQIQTQSFSDSGSGGGGYIQIPIVECYGVENVDYRKYNDTCYYKENSTFVRTVVEKITVKEQVPVEKEVIKAVPQPYVPAPYKIMFVAASIIVIVGIYYTSKARVIT